MTVVIEVTVHDCQMVRRAGKRMETISAIAARYHGIERQVGMIPAGRDAVTAEIAHAQRAERERIQRCAAGCYRQLGGNLGAAAAIVAIAD